MSKQTKQATSSSNKSPTLFISVGDPSGDEYASQLIENLKKKLPLLQIYGLGGPKMKAAGASILRFTTHKSSIGFLEPLKYIFSYLTDLQVAFKWCKKKKPNYVLVIDHQGFNMSLLKKIKKLNLNTGYYICPQEWHWGREKNAKKVVNLCDDLFCIYKPAAEYYKNLGANAYFVGHPLLESLSISKASTKKDSILLLPGSRKQEINQLAPLLARYAKTQSKGTLKLCVSVQHDRFKKKLEKAFKGLEVSWHTQLNPKLLDRCKFAIACSGSISLKLALLKIPSVIIYKFHPLSYALAKLILGSQLKKIPYFALPNMLLKRALFPELLQHKATVENIIDCQNKVQSSQASFDSQLAELKNLLENAENSLSSSKFVTQRLTLKLKLEASNS